MSESCCHHTHRAFREGIPVAITEAELADQKLGLRLAQGSQKHAEARRRAHLGALDWLLLCVRAWVGASGAEPEKDREQRTENDWQGVASKSAIAVAGQNLLFISWRQTAPRF